MVAQIEKLVPQLAERDVRASSAARMQLADLGAEAAPLLWERLLKVGGHG